MSITNGKMRSRLIPQVTLLFAFGILVTGIITCFTQRSISDSAIQEQIETLAYKVAEETVASIREYPAYDSAFLLVCPCGRAGERIRCGIRRRD